MEKEVVFEIPKRDKEGKEVLQDGKPVMDKFHVVMRRLSYGEKAELEEEITDVKLVANTQSATVSVLKLRIISILKCIVFSDYPNLKTWEGIFKLPDEVGELLFQTYVELNGTNLKKNN